MDRLLYLLPVLACPIGVGLTMAGHVQPARHLRPPLREQFRPLPAPLLQGLEIAWLPNPLRPLQGLRRAGQAHRVPDLRHGERRVLDSRQVVLTSTRVGPVS